MAAFTEEPTLATAAWLDFKAHILRLLEAGHLGLARELWESVVEIDHHPALPLSALSIEGLPPIKRMPCLVQPCTRCSTKRGGFKFPWIGLWTKRAVLVRADRPPSEAWRRYSECGAQLSFDEVRRASLRVSAAELAPQHVVDLTAAVASEQSPLEISDFFLAWRGSPPLSRYPLGAGRDHREHGQGEPSLGMVGRLVSWYLPPPSLHNLC